jgi:cellulose biosynthesis protein BcsQ
MLYGVYPLHRLLEDNSRKSYGEDKAHRNSTNNINSSTSLQILRQTYTTKVFQTVIPRNTDIRDTHFNKQNIFAFNNQAKAAFAYDKLIRELFL